jgi:hypothetical protein
MKYFTREHFCENWTYVKSLIENIMFSNFVVGTANLAWKWEDPPNVTPIYCTIGRIFPFSGKICCIHGKFWKFGVFNGVFHICLIFTKMFSCEIFHVFSNALQMIVIALSNFGWVKSYGLVYRVLYCVALVIP